ncbi:MAG: Holliday junction resolvase RuvX [Bacteroidota bacterium]
MARILAIDYGSKRVGLAVSDPQQIIANGLTTVHSNDVMEYLQNYISEENVECIVVGEPKQMNNKPSGSAKIVNGFVKNLKKKLPGILIEKVDERFTSKLASRAMLNGGLKKKDRQNKELVDKISAILILQSYLDIKNRKS